MSTRKNAADYIDFNALLKSYLSKWYVFAISVILCLGLGYLYTRMNNRPMEVKANILISQEDDGPFGVSSSSPAAASMGSLFGSSAYVEDEIFVITSHSLYCNVAKSLGLDRMHYVSPAFLKSYLAYPDFPVDVVGPAGIADTLTRGLTFKVNVSKDGLADIRVKNHKNKTIVKANDVKLPYVVKTDIGDFTVKETPSFPKGEKVKTLITVGSYDSAAEQLTRDVVADLASKKSNVITLQLNTPNTDFGSDVLNKILEKYNERGIYEKNLQGKKTATFLEDRIDLMGKDLETAEIAIQNYKQSNGITDLEVEAEYRYKTSGSLESQLYNMETELELLRITREFFMDSIHSNELVPTTVSTASVQQGIETYNAMVLERLDLLNNAKGDNIALRRIDQRMAMTRRNMLATTDRAIEATALRIKELKAQQGDNRSMLSRIPVQEREYINMKRQQEMKQELYLFLLQRQEENTLMLSNAIPKGKIVDEAYVIGDPLGMSNKVIMLAALLVGLFLPFVGLYLYKIIRNKFEDRKEVERHVSAPILGEMCVDRSGRKMVVTADDTSSATELFRLMRSNLQFMLSGDSDKVVLVTSTVSGEGKSFISSNLAASLSLLEGKRVLLVGMDIRNPQLENYLDIHPRFGLTNYLSSSAVSLDEIIVPLAGYKSLDVIVAGPVPPNPSELLASRKVDELFATLRTRYDYIVVDSAPVGMVSDTFTLDRIADATVYVTRVNYSSLNDLRFIEEIYDDKRLKKLSVVVNGTASKKGYGYGYGRDHKGTKN